jgi:hypothetical protein
MLRVEISRSVAAAVFLTVLVACGGSHIPYASSGAPNATLEVQRPLQPQSVIDGHALIEDGRVVAGTHVLLPHHVIGPIPPGPDPTLNLIYHGGRVMTFPAVGVVYWGFGSTGDPDREIPLINSFMRRLSGSAPLRVITQYYEISNGQKIHIPNYPAMSFATWKDDTDPLPAPHPRDSDVRAEAQRAAARFNFQIPGVDNLIIVAIPHGISMRYAACAYHGKTGAITYTNLPYQPDFGAACGAYSVHHGPEGVLDGVTETVIHEVAESMSDPYFGGWYDRRGLEIGDKCQQYAASELFKGREYAVQPLWSNKTGACTY